MGTELGSLHDNTTAYNDALRLAAQGEVELAHHRLTRLRDHILDTREPKSTRWLLPKVNEARLVLETQLERTRTVDVAVRASRRFMPTARAIDRIGHLLICVFLLMLLVLELAPIVVTRYRAFWSSAKSEDAHVKSIPLEASADLAAQPGQFLWIQKTPPTTTMPSSTAGESSGRDVTRLRPPASARRRHALVRSIAPTVGPTAGGTYLVIEGDHFGRTAEVFVDGQKLRAIVVNAQTIVATTESHSTGLVNVAVVDETASTLLHDAFMFVLVAEATPPQLPGLDHQPMLDGSRRPPKR